MRSPQGLSAVRSWRHISCFSLRNVRKVFAISRVHFADRESPLAKGTFGALCPSVLVICSPGFQGGPQPPHQHAFSATVFLQFLEILSSFCQYTSPVSSDRSLLLYIASPTAIYLTFCFWPPCHLTFLCRFPSPNISARFCVISSLVAVLILSSTILICCLTYSMIFYFINHIFPSRRSIFKNLPIHSSEFLVMCSSLKSHPLFL